MLGASRIFTGADAGSTLTEAAHENAVDVIIETVGGNADTLGDAIHLVRRGGTVVVLGVFTGMTALNALSLMAKEVRLVGSLTYGRSGARADFDVALGLLADQPECFRRLITHRMALADITRAFETAADKHSGSIKVMIQPA
jgi:threonine dehydrogenase-like Zn-dependent dehydrogenase